MYGGAFFSLFGVGIRFVLLFLSFFLIIVEADGFTLASVKFSKLILLLL